MPNENLTMKQVIDKIAQETVDRLDTKVDKASGVTDVSYNSSTKKFTETINSVPSDIVSASTLKTDMELNNVTNDKQVKGLSSGTTINHIVLFGSDGYTIKDSGKSIDDVGKVATVSVNEGTPIEPDANKNINITVPLVDQTYDSASTNAQSGTAVAGAVSNKQDTLVSGTNIKTINGNSVLGSGDLDVNEIGIIELSGTSGTLTTAQFNLFANKKTVVIKYLDGTDGFYRYLKYSYETPLYYIFNETTYSNTNMVIGGIKLQIVKNDMTWSYSRDSKYAQEKLSTTIVSDGTINKNIGFDAGGNLVKQIPQKGVEYCSLKNSWSTKTWTGLTNFYGYNVWTDGTNIYYSGGNSSSQYVLDKSTSTWSTKTWSGSSSVGADKIWTDGDNIYYSFSGIQKVLDKSTSTWNNKTWTGLTSFQGQNVWSDGDNIYFSSSSSHYVLNKATSTWSTKTWTGLTSFDGQYIWTDGTNIYYSDGSSNQYVLDKSTSTWSRKTWTGLGNPACNYIWTDGDNIYHSSSTTHYVLDKSTSKWCAKTWTGLTRFYGDRIWTDGTNIYYSSDLTQYVLDKEVFTSQYVSKAAVTGSYKDLTNLPVLNSDNYSSLPTSSYEPINNIINLHKIAKTGSFNDLRDTPNLVSYSKGTIVGGGEYQYLSAENYLTAYEDDYRLFDESDKILDAYYGAYGIQIFDEDTEQKINLKFPYNKAPGTYTLATTDDAGGSIEMDDIR